MASGNFSVVTGGQGNRAPANCHRPGRKRQSRQWSASFAVGNRAKTQTAGGSPAVHDGAFVFGDSSAFDFNTTDSNEFAVRATGGVRFVTSIDGAGTPVKTLSIDSVREPRHLRQC